MVEGPSLDKHHLVPKSRKGKDPELVHIVCHGKIHSTFDENTLAREYNTWEALKAHPEIKKYIKWVQKKFARDPEFVDRHKDTRDRKRRRR
jgi:hypothetical protein